MEAVLQSGWVFNDGTFDVLSRSEFRLRLFPVNYHKQQRMTSGYKYKLAPLED